MAKVTIIQPTKDDSSIQKLRCAAYCRVSSSSEDQLHSYAVQVKYYSEVFNGSETEELVDIYADEGITGTCEDKRDEFKRLIKDCKRGKIDRIYVKSISRFARNTKDCLKNMRELKELGITVFFEKENIDTTKVNDEMMITIMGGLAQEESTSISQNMRWSIQRRMREGKFIPSCTPYGYKLENGRFAIDLQTAEVVKMIYSWYLNGMGVSMIVQKLNEMKIPTSQNGTIWGNNAVEYILTNEKYIGDMLLQKTWSTDTMPVVQHTNIGEKEQYLVKQSHEALISEETFYKVQKLIAENGKHYHGKNGEKSAFSKVIKCGECAGSYKRKKTNGNYFWVCTRHDLKADNCPSHQIPEESIKQAFITLSNKLILHHREILLPLQRSLQDLNARKNSGNSKIIDIRRDIVAVKEQKHVISRLRTKGFLDEQKYNEQLTALESKQSRLERELNKISKANDEDETLEQLDTLIDCFEGRTETLTEFDEELFSMIIEKIVLKDNTLEFNIISGLRFIEKI